MTPQITQSEKLDYIIGRPRGLRLEPPALDPDWKPDLTKTHDPIDLRFTGPASSVHIQYGDLVMAGTFDGKVIAMSPVGCPDTVEVRGRLDWLPGIEMTAWFPVGKLRRMSESCWQYED